MQADTWMGVAGLFDGLTIAVALDGKATSGPCRIGRVVPSAGGVLAVGGKFDGAAWSEVFRGNIDEVRLRASSNLTLGRPFGACQVGEAVTGINDDGSLACGSAAPQRVIRYNTFDTYIESCCWNANDDSQLFGGVNPSSWTDGNAVAWQMSSDAATLRTLFNRKIYPGPNALISAEHWSDGSSTNGKVTVALLRIRNDTAQFIDWQPIFYFTSYVDWGEQASVTINGEGVWSSGSNSGPNEQAAPFLTLPPQQTSTVIFVVPSSPGWNPHAQWYRMNFLAFVNNSLDLPQGLMLVDDLDSLQGPLWQQQPNF